MTAQDLFNAIFNASLAIMVTTLVAGLGMALTVRQIVAPLSKVKVLGAAVLFNSVLAPLIAVGVCDLLPLSTESRVGLELATIAAAGPVGMKAAEFTKRADMAMALSFTIVLQLVNIAAAPLWAKQVVTGATVDLWTIVKDLLLLVLAPLAIGLILRGRYPEHAKVWKPDLEKASNLALLTAIAVGLAVNWSLLVSSIGSWVLLASAIIVIIYIALGWVAGRVGDAEAAITVSMVSSMRFTPIGLVVIAAVLHNQGAYLIPALLFSLVDTVIPLATGMEIGRVDDQSTKAAAASTTKVGSAA